MLDNMLDVGCYVETFNIYEIFDDNESWSSISNIIYLLNILFIIVIIYLIAQILGKYIHIIPASYCTHKYNSVIIFAFIIYYIPFIIFSILTYTSLVETICEIIEIYCSCDNFCNTKKQEKNPHIHFNINNNIETNLEQIMTEGYPSSLS